MTSIKEVCLSLYDAMNRYQVLENEVDKVKKGIDFFNNYLNDAKDKEIAQKRKSQVVIFETREKRKRAIRDVALKNICYLLGVGISYPILINIGVSFPVWGLAIHVIIHLIMIVVLNEKSIPNLLKSIKDHRNAQECGKLSIYQDGKEINQLVALLYEKWGEMTAEMNTIAAYLQEVDKNLADENIKVANEILESHGIDATIEVKITEKKLRN